MTRDDLIQELPRLQAFAKIVSLDRETAYWILWSWLEGMARSPHRLEEMARRDVYRAVAFSQGADIHALRAPVLPADPLLSDVLRGVSRLDRAHYFLTGPAGFSAEVADEIMMEPSYNAIVAWRRPQRETQARHA